jgi:2-(1,2-epoxy-1,2-dihydrophenyl)acetyl-CoA isomerase
MKRMAHGKLLVTLENRIKTITFNQPERKNAVDAETTQALCAAIEEARHDESRVLVLTGAGGDFCAGADLKSRVSSTEDVGEYLRTVVNPTILGLRSLPKPVIAKVRGVAVGIGCNYALAADIRIASEDARFGQIFARIGLMPDGGSTYFLPHLIGYGRAFEWMATAEIVDARKCLEWGVVNYVVPGDQLDAKVAELADRLANGPSLAIAGIKRALNAGDSGTLADALEAEAAGQRACFSSADFREGVAAFLEKRKAVFAGR